MSAHITTSGIEFEACLVYSEETLQNVLREYHINHMAIIKGHPLPYDASINTDGLLCPAFESERCRQHYPSWRLAVSCEEADLFHHMSNTSSFTQENQHIRRLFMEQLLVAKKALAMNDLKASVCGLICRPDILPGASSSSPGDHLVCPYDKVDYTKWTLTNDCSLAGSLPSQIIAAINSINAGNIRQHNSSGLEIITPIFHFADLDASCDEIDAYLGAISNEKTCHAMTSVWVGMHVHVGVAAHISHSQNEAFIRNLLYILLLHEDLITQCFPRNRSGEDNDNHNRTPPGSESSKNAGSSIDNLCSFFENLTSEELDRQWKDDKAAATEQARRNSMSDNELVAEHLAREQKAIAENERAVLAAEANHTNLWETHSNARCFAEKWGLEWPLE